MFLNEIHLIYSSYKMKLTLPRYSILLFFQFALLIADLFFNTFAPMLFYDKLHVAFVMFVLQDVFIICEYLFFAFAVHSTCIYEVGATYVLLRNCKFFLLTILTYFLLSAGQHIYIAYNTIWSTPALNFQTTLTAISLIRRLVSVVYYYSYKRTALCISDPRYYEQNIDWIANQLSER